MNTLPTKKVPSTHLVEFASRSHAGLLACPEVNGSPVELAESAVMHAAALCDRLGLTAWHEPVTRHYHIRCHSCGNDANVAHESINPIGTMTCPRCRTYICTVEQIAQSK